MRWLVKDPDSIRSASGLEWAIWRRLPRILAWGSLLPLLAWLIAWWHAGADPVGPTDPGLLRFGFVMIGVVVLHWTLVLTVAIGCAIVMLMKGPRYMADSYPMPDADAPRE